MFTVCSFVIALRNLIIWSIWKVALSCCSSRKAKFTQHQEPHGTRLCSTLSISLVWRFQAEWPFPDNASSGFDATADHLHIYQFDNLRRNTIKRNILKWLIPYPNWGAARQPRGRFIGPYLVWINIYQVNAAHISFVIYKFQTEK